MRDHAFITRTGLCLARLFSPIIVPELVTGIGERMAFRVVSAQRYYADCSETENLRAPHTGTVSGALTVTLTCDAVES